MNHEPIIQSYLRAGLSIIPIKRDGSKGALVEWKQYEERIATEDELSTWVRWGVEGWGMVCGKVSGNVEVLDFDEPGFFTEWREQIDDTLYNRLVIQNTPSGGRHVIFRAPMVEHNQRLARTINRETGKVSTAIETRGEGGQILVEPTTGAYHETGRPYRIAQGSLLAIPEITLEERGQMFAAATVLNEYWPETKQPKQEPGDGNGEFGSYDDPMAPGNVFNREASWEEVLEPAGWKALYSRNGRTAWQRPGKDGKGASAVTGGKSKRNGFAGLYVFSSNAEPFNVDSGYSKFGAYGLLYHGGNFSDAAVELNRLGYGRKLIVRPRATPALPGMAVADIPDRIDDLTGTGVPPLPESARFDPALGDGVAHWLDEYVALSRLWSPRAYDDFHTACALWILSTIAARRVVCHLGGTRYTNLYIALVARSSLWAKSTTAKIVNQTLREAGLSWLLAPDDSTPQRFISDLVRRAPSDWDELDMAARGAASLRMAFPAQRGWFYEEMGQKIDAMLNVSGFMSDFRGILRSFDDCPEEYSYASIGRGLDPVQQPYIAMLGNMTPADLQRATHKSPGLWQDGFWARWAFVTPPGDSNSSRARFPEGERTIPGSLVEPIRAWHERLGVPGVDVEEKRSDDGKPDGFTAFADPIHRTAVTVTPEAREAFYCYHDALLDVVEGLDNRDFDGNYARFAEKALRVAMLLASLENDDIITLPVWVRAQGIAERWRRSLHELYAQANEPPASEAVRREEQVMQIVVRLGEASPNEVRRYMRGLSNAEVTIILEGLANSGALVRVAETRKGMVRYALSA